MSHPSRHRPAAAVQTVPLLYVASSPHFFGAIFLLLPSPTWSLYATTLEWSVPVYRFTGHDRPAVSLLYRVGCMGCFLAISWASQLKATLAATTFDRRNYQLALSRDVWGRSAPMFGPE